MRTQLLFVALALLLTPTVSAGGDQPGVVYDYTVELPDRDCLDCFTVAAQAAQTVPKNCADCGGWGVAVGVSNDDEGTHWDAQVCRGGFFYFCVVDEHRTI